MDGLSKERQLGSGVVNADGGSGLAMATDITALPGLKELWAETLGDPRICIAVLDGPADRSHPCLRGARLTVVDGFAPPACQAGGPSSCGHGTHVVSILFAQHGSGPLRGIAPGCRGLLLPIFRDDPGNPGRIRPSSQDEVARAILRALEMGAQVINISAGQLTAQGQSLSARLQDAIGRCAQAGVLIVSAAGNDGCNCVHLPAALAGVLTVGAADQSGRPAAFSNFGAPYLRQGVLASGENILGARPGGGFVRRTGTSVATPIVSGVVALLLSAGLQHGPRRFRPTGGVVQETPAGTAGRPHGPRPLTAVEARDLILRTARRCDLGDAAACRRFLVGVLDVRRAMELYYGDRQMNTTPLTDDLPDQMEANSPPDAAVAGNGASTNVPEGDRASPDVPDTPPAPAPAAGPRACANPVSQAKARAAVPPMPPPRVPATVRQSAAGTRPDRISASACGCGGGGPVQLVYALGSLDYDFGTQVRFESVDNFLKATVPPEGDLLPSAYDKHDMIVFLRAAPFHSESIIWTLNYDQIPLYAIRPEGPYAQQTYETLVRYLDEQLDNEVRAERVSVPGILSGSVTLLSGQSVPVIVPDLRGLWNWKTAALVSHVVGAKPTREAPQREHDEFEDKVRGVQNFLQRVYYELSNRGQTPQERAMNFAATNAFVVNRIFQNQSRERRELDEIEVVRSGICRPDSDCWDILLTFFLPDNVQTSRHVARYTIDVSDVIPVQIGDVREYAVR